MNGNITANQKSNFDRTGFFFSKKALLDQFGLERVSSREPVEMLVVEKV